MKINSTDAAIGMIKKVSGTEVNIEKSSVKSDHTENLSQMTKFERSLLPISEKILIKAIEKANKALSGVNRRLEFSIHEKTKETMVKVIDSESNEIIREIPPEKILDMVAKMWEMAGLMVDERR